MPPEPTGPTGQTILSDPPYNFIKVETNNFKNDLEYSTPDIQGWQITLIKENGEINFHFAKVISTIQDGIKIVQVESPKKATMGLYELIVGYDQIELPKKYLGEVHQSNQIFGPFSESVFEIENEIEFFYLSKLDLDFMLINEATEIYISTCTINFGGGLATVDGSNYSMLKIECADENGVFQIQVNNNAPSPLFVLAPPCPPKWNNSIVGGGGLEGERSELYEFEIIKTKPLIPLGPIS